MTDLHQLRVLLNKEQVGTITRLADDRTIFTFEREYLQNSNRSILSLGFKAAGGGVIAEQKVHRLKLLPFFSNLLPEGHLRTYLAEKLKVHPQREYFLLAELGDDLPGAVTVEHDGIADDLIHIAHEPDEHDPHEPLRFSLAGVQLKFSAVLEGNGRITIPVEGKGGSWIVKLPAGRFENVPDAEFAMMTLARYAGIDVPEFRLVPTQSIENLPEEFRNTLGESFVIRRFDRLPDGSRVHMEDFAQVFGLYSDDKYRKKSYANIAEVLWAEAGEQSLIEFVRRLVFNIAIGNGDMHLKNWSLLYADPTKPTLSPAYDFIPTIAFMENQALALSLGSTKPFNEITKENFAKMAAKARIPDRLVMRALAESIEAVRESWERQKGDLAISGAVASAIDHHMSTLTLFNETQNVPGVDLMDYEPGHAARVFGDVELDPSVPLNRVRLESRSGQTVELDAPARMKPWIVADFVNKKARDLASDSPVTVLVGEQLYRDWRKEKYITIPRAVLSTSELSRLTEHNGTLHGEFSPEVWRRIMLAYRDDHWEQYDMLMSADTLRTFEARILKIQKEERIESGLTSASLRLSIRKSHQLMRPGEGTHRRMFTVSPDKVQRALTIAFDELGWMLDLFDLDSEHVFASKDIKVAYVHQLIDAPFSLSARLDFNGIKTVLFIKVNAEEHPLKDVSLDQAATVAAKVDEILKHAGNIQ